MRTKAGIGRKALAGAVGVLLVGSSLPAFAAGEKFAVYGADLTPEWRRELAEIFGVEPDAGETVTTEEMAAALNARGITVTPDDKSISSAGLTCRERGQGLDVRTQNITRMTAPVYANALVTAGIGDASVLVAAPQSNPVTGETALVGVLKAFPQCQAGKQPEPGRVALAYEQIAQTVAVAGEGGDLNKASAALLKAAQPVILGQAGDDAAIGAALDDAMASEGVAVDPSKRGELIAFMSKLKGVDYGTYAQGFRVEQLSPTEARVAPAGAGAAGAPGATGAAGAAGAAGQARNGAPAGGRFDGEVGGAGQTPTVRTGDGERQIQPGPGLVVMRDGRSASLTDIRAGDRVAVTTNPDGTARRVDARSAAALAADDDANRWRWLAPLALLIPLFGALFFLLGRRRRHDYVVERRETIVDGRGDRTTTRARTLVEGGRERGTTVTTERATERDDEAITRR